jgi:TonB family protein
MIPSIFKWISGTAVFSLIMAWPGTGMGAGEKVFAFVNSRYAITAEIASDHKFVVNFINFSDFVVVLQPNEFIYKGASGRFYIGQVYELEGKNARGELQKYAASYLMKGRSFAGLSIIGAFREQDQIEEISVRIGAKRFYLQPMESTAFEQLAAKIGSLDLGNPNTAASLEEANIPELGTVKSTDGTSEWDKDWQGLISTDGVNPPKIIERPEIPLTDEARKSRVYGKVKISGIINKSGGIQDLKLVKGLERSLDKRALEGVRNSWVFLPATKNGEVTDAVFTLDVEFPPPASKTSER